MAALSAYVDGIERGQRHKVLKLCTMQPDMPPRNRELELPSNINAPGHSHVPTGLGGYGWMCPGESAPAKRNPTTHGADATSSPGSLPTGTLGEGAGL